MSIARDVLSPSALEMLQAVARSGSFAGAARELGLVPSALTYRVRQMEDALDVLLFDRSSRQARPTAAGRELLREGARLLAEVDAVAGRVQRIATGWEARFTLAVDGLIAQAPLMELLEAFFALQPPTRVKVRAEILSGAQDALASGQADLAFGVGLEPGTAAGLAQLPLGDCAFVLAMAPHHPLAAAGEPIADGLLRAHRQVAVADTRQHGEGVTVGVLPGQDVLTLPTMQAKLDAQLRGLGIGFLPEPMVRPYLRAGLLVTRAVVQPRRATSICYAWRATAEPGRALQWWLAQLERPGTRRALLEQHPDVPPAAR